MQLPCGISTLPVVALAEPLSVADQADPRVNSRYLRERRAQRQKSLLYRRLRPCLYQDKDPSRFVHKLRSGTRLQFLNKADGATGTALVKQQKIKAQPSATAEIVPQKDLTQQRLVSKSDASQQYWKVTRDSV